jgi:hypothetical protein
LEKRIEINNNFNVSVFGQTRPVRSFWNRPLLLSNFGQQILEFQQARFCYGIPLNYIQYLNSNRIKCSVQTDWGTTVKKCNQLHEVSQIIRLDECSILIKQTKGKKQSTRCIVCKSLHFLSSRIDIYATSEKNETFCDESIND